LLRRTSDQPLEIAQAALTHAKTRYYDVLIVDTAGRLAIDEAMMWKSKPCTLSLTDRNLVRGGRDARPGCGQHRQSL